MPKRRQLLAASFLRELHRERLAGDEGDGLKADVSGCSPTGVRPGLRRLVTRALRDESDAACYSSNSTGANPAASHEAST